MVNIMVETVDCYLIKNNCYLMLHRNKKQNDMNHDKYIGIGGHIENGETKEEACIREIKEETGLTVHSLEYAGEILFVNDNYEEMMYIFKTNDFSGELIECDEGTLQWVPIDKVLDLNLWEGDRKFLPKLRNGEFIKMKLIYNNDKLIRCEEL